MGIKVNAGLRGLLFSNGLDRKNVLTQLEFNPELLKESLLPEESQPHVIHSFCEACICREYEAVS